MVYMLLCIIVSCGRIRVSDIQTIVKRLLSERPQKRNNDGSKSWQPFEWIHRIQV